MAKIPIVPKEHRPTLNDLNKLTSKFAFIEMSTGKKYYAYAPINVSIVSK